MGKRGRRGGEKHSTTVKIAIYIAISYRRGLYGAIWCYLKLSAAQIARIAQLSAAQIAICT